MASAAGPFPPYPAKTAGHKFDLPHENTQLGKGHRTEIGGQRAYFEGVTGILEEQGGIPTP